jgi:hypothetical protein
VLPVRLAITAVVVALAANDSSARAISAATSRPDSSSIRQDQVGAILEFIASAYDAINNQPKSLWIKGRIFEEQKAISENRPAALIVPSWTGFSYQQKNQKRRLQWTPDGGAETCWIDDGSCLINLRQNFRYVYRPTSDRSWGAMATGITSFEAIQYCAGYWDVGSAMRSLERDIRDPKHITTVQIEMRGDRFVLTTQVDKDYRNIVTIDGDAGFHMTDRIENWEAPTHDEHVVVHNHYVKDAAGTWYLNSASLDVTSRSGNAILHRKLEAIEEASGDINIPESVFDKADVPMPNIRTVDDR